MRKLELGKSKIFFAMITILLTIYCIACALLQSLSWYYGIYFAAYQVFGICSVGYAALHLLKIEAKNKLEEFGFSILFGYSCNILIYFLVFPFWGANGLIIAFWLLVIAALVKNYFYLKKRTNENLTNSDTNFVLVILFIILIFQFFVVAANNCASELLGVNSYYVDLFYSASDIVTLKKQFPPINFRMIDIGTYYYHYFSSVQLAVVSLITGISAHNLMFGFSHIQSAFLLVFGCYVFFNQVMNKRFFKYICIILCLFSTGLELYSWVTSVSHMYAAPFGFDIGLVYEMIIIILMIRQVEARKFKVNYFIVITVLFGICVGLKSPVACITLSVLGCICLGLILKREKNSVMMAFAYGVPFLIIFVLMFFLVVNGSFTGASKLESFVGEGMSATILNQPQVAAVHDILINQYTTIGGQILFLIYYVLLVNPAVYTCAFIGAIFHICHGEKIEYLDIILLIGSLIGIVFTRGLKLTGFSQIYFIMSVTPLVIAFGMRGFSKLYIRYQKECSATVYGRGVKIFSIMLVVVGIILFTNSYYFQPQFLSGLKKMGNVIGAYGGKDIYLNSMYGDVRCEEISDVSREDYHYIVVDEAEKEAALWINKNTDEESIIVTNVIETSNYQYSYAMGVLAERWIWMGDEELIFKAINGDKVAISELIDRDIRYMLIKNNNTSEWEDESIVYKNMHVIVVDLLKS